MSDRRQGRRDRRLQPWGETAFFLVVAVLLGGVLFGAVWTRIEEFEKGSWDAYAIAQAIVLGLILIALIVSVWAYLSRRVRDR